jgi:ATP-dependent DNA ligase
MDFKPMSAVILENKSNKIIYPADAQPKLDGFRGIAMKKKEILILSRNGNIYPHLQKIKKELNSFSLIKKGYSLDGELYCHGIPLKKLRSVLGRKTLTNNVKNLESKINYYIFDIIDKNIPSDKRLKILKDSFKNFKSDKIKLVPSFTVKSLKEINKLREKFINDGYEGIIVRNKQGLYKFGKSLDIFRSKNFKQQLFTIVDGIEGKGSNKGTVIWKLQCLKDKNKTFRARPIGTKKERELLFKNKDNYIGKQIKIKYYELDEITGCVSRHPIALFIE